MSMKKGDHYVYKYVCGNEIIYIGKTDGDLSTRINQHSHEDKFKEYLNSSSIYYIQLANKAETKGYESLLINKYKPKLNDIDKYDSSSNIRLIEPVWVSYDQYLETKKNEAAESPTNLKIKIGNAKNLRNKAVDELEKSNYKKKHLEDIYNNFNTYLTQGYYSVADHKYVDHIPHFLSIKYKNGGKNVRIFDYEVKNIQTGSVEFYFADEATESYKYIPDYIAATLNPNIKGHQKKYENYKKKLCFLEEQYNKFTTCTETVK